MYPLRHKESDEKVELRNRKRKREEKTISFACHRVSAGDCVCQRAAAGMGCAGSSVTGIYHSMEGTGDAESSVCGRTSRYVSFWDAADAATDRFQAAVPAGTTDGQEVRLAGKIDRIEPKTRCVYYYLKDCTVEAESQTLPCNDVIAYVSSASHSAGQILNIEGTISLFTEASNEGMFDARQFYQSQKIDFGIWVTKISRVYGKPDRYRCALQNMKKRANDVIRHSIRDDGVLSAMLLGEKGALDAEIKSLNQRAGIAHVLAISGLHISLLGMGLYRSAETTAYPVCDSSAGNDQFF